MGLVGERWHCRCCVARSSWRERRWEISRLLRRENVTAWSSDVDLHYSSQTSETLWTHHYEPQTWQRGTDGIRAYTQHPIQMPIQERRTTQAQTPQNLSLAQSSSTRLLLFFITRLEIAKCTININQTVSNAAKVYSGFWSFIFYFGLFIRSTEIFRKYCRNFL